MYIRYVAVMKCGVRKIYLVNGLIHKRYWFSDATKVSMVDVIVSDNIMVEHNINRNKYFYIWTTIKTCGKMSVSDSVMFYQLSRVNCLNGTVKYY